MTTLHQTNPRERLTDVVIDPQPLPAIEAFVKTADLVSTYIYPN
jgi:hypothetical protein